MTRTAHSLTGAVIALLPLLCGCAVGPDFARPDPPVADRFTGAPLPVTTASASVSDGAAQRFIVDADIPGEWWTLFRSPALDTLVKEALANNPNITAAEAALRQARELRMSGEGAFFPLVQANPNVSANKTAASLSPNTANGNLYYSLYTAQLSVSYTPDLFGGTRRQVESLLAQEDAQRFQLQAADLTLTSNLVAAAIGEAGLRDQIAAVTAIIAAERESLGILQKQLGLGQVAGADVAAQQAALAQAEATLPPLQKQLAQQRDLIAVLAGRLPSNQPNATFDLTSLQLPQDLPVSLPSRLVEQRPDIRAAEANLHAASAQIGVAIANMLPQIDLTANPGLTATTLGQLFTPGAAFWTLAAGATQTIFDAGSLLHKRRAADDAFDQAAAQYKATVLTAFQNVADTLEALNSDANLLAAAAAAEKAAQQSLDITRRQLSAGAINYLALLNAQQTYEQAVINRVQAQASRLADTAALFQALGGGWWNRPAAAEPKEASFSPIP
ncbi:MAG TPA: efflux transporter outer membrane subunit [Stellaceae bacterium]|nr:efflux transporter outer membrane subunit [Stellaceae bacterium]